MYKYVCWAISITIIFSNIVRNTDASCTFPTELDGIWYSSHKGALNFTSTTLYTYPIYMSATVSSLDLNCDIQDGYKYLLKSTESVFAFGQQIEAYICIELYRISQYKYYYYLGTLLTRTNNDYVYGKINGSIVAMSEACNRNTPYETGTFITLVKEGAFASEGALATCPSSILASYSSVTISDFSGSTVCDGNVLNACADNTALKFTYQSCTSGLAFSTAGYFYCIYHKISGDNTYLMVWNNDTTVDGSTTYRSTCLVITTDGSTLHATEHPGFCSDTTQSSTYVPSPGIKYVMTSQAETCVTSVQGGKSGAYYFLITLGILLGIAGLFIGIVCYVKYKNKIRMMELDIYKKETLSRPVSSIPMKSRSNVDSSSLPSKSKMDVADDWTITQHKSNSHETEESSSIKNNSKTDVNEDK